MSQANLANMHKFPSVSSIHSMVSLGYLPPGHGYIPKKQRPDKPYGPSYITIMNRTWRGPGRKYLRYALVCFCLAMLFYISAALYFAHRNVSRMIVRHSEPTGACLLIIAIGLTSLMFHLIYKARLESNRWRFYTKFRADGLFHVAPTNEHYHPEDPTKLTTGTYGPRAVKEIPKPRHMRGRSRPGSRPGGRQKNQPMTTLVEDDEALLGDEMGSQDYLDSVPAGYNNQGGPQRFDDAPMPLVHKPQPQRPSGEPYPPPPQMDKVPFSEPPQARMPPPQARMTPEPRYIQHPQARMTPDPRFMQQERMPPQARMTPEPRYMQHERMPPQVRMTPEPRIVPIDRMPIQQARMTPDPRPPAGFKQTPEPKLQPLPERMAPGTRQTPEPKLPPPPERMAPGARPTPEPRLAPPPSRAPAGAFKTPEPRAIPGQGKTQTQPRMVPGQSRPPAGPGRATPRE